MSNPLYRFFVIAGLWYLTVTMVLIAWASQASANQDSITTFDGKWKGLLVCTGKGGEFSSARGLQIKDGILRYERGTENEDRFEVWHGVVDYDQEVFILGRYFWKGEKEIWLRGRIEKTGLRAEGHRGPKSCNLHMKRLTSSS